ncbi:hypothetical protein [Paraburkholderia heleia]|uniref:hypothetical protein n=1 Tax=Paraburkholderia heleia TaxID=634127 RepID=UPI0005AA589E|nr:hypothetical protein [Paraburkholderia heleia]
MIYVVELPVGGKPKAWFAYDEADFARKVAASDPLRPEEIYDSVTPRELLEFSGQAPDVGARTQYPSICAIGDAHGWDTPLYRADYLLGRGVCQHEPVTLLDASLAALNARGHCLVYLNDRAAISAFEGADARLAGKSHWSARRALYEQLVALEVLADDN